MDYQLKSCIENISTHDHHILQHTSLLSNIQQELYNMINNIIPYKASIQDVNKCVKRIHFDEIITALGSTLDMKADGILYIYIYNIYVYI